MRVDFGVLSSLNQSERLTKSSSLPDPCFAAGRDARFGSGRFGSGRLGWRTGSERRGSGLGAALGGSAFAAGVGCAGRGFGGADGVSSMSGRSLTAFRRSPIGSRTRSVRDAGAGFGGCFAGAGRDGAWARGGGSGAARGGGGANEDTGSGADAAAESPNTARAACARAS